MQTGNILDQMRKDALQCFNASLKAVDPYEAVKRFIVHEGSRLTVGRHDSTEKVFDLDDYDRIFLAGGGKATAPMAKAMEDILGSRITAGLINVKYGFSDELACTEITEADHPLPDQKGVEGTKKILRMIEAATERDLIFSLISGGGSALLPQPAGEISLLEKQEVTRRLLECGASIDEINCIRKHISSSKGGQMARSAYPATTINLMLSDVVGDKMDVIASGPFVPDISTYRDAKDIIDKYSLEKIPLSVSAHLEAGLSGKIDDTPKTGDPVFEKVSNVIIGSNILALEAAAREAESLGYTAVILSSMIQGETRDVARVHTAIAMEVIKTGMPVNAPCCIISGGETTVTIKGKGKGGRNQEFCLAAAMDIKDIQGNAVILSGGTDGNDGPTDAAGGIVDPGTTARGDASGISANAYLTGNDSYNYLKQTGDLLITGPTKTNVMDVRMVFIR